MKNIVTVKTFTIHGIDAVPTTVEVSITDGIGIHLVGLPDREVKESLLRTITALQSLGYQMPGKKIVINVSPNTLFGGTSGLDLPIAIGIIAASGQENLTDFIPLAMAGELGLDGSLRPVGGEYIMSLSAPEGFVVSSGSARSLYGKTGTEQVLCAESLSDVVSILTAEDKGQWRLTNMDIEAPQEECKPLDLAYIKGNEGAKRGLEIAAAGRHDVMLISPAGSEAMVFANAMRSITPELTQNEFCEVEKNFSARKTERMDGKLIPFRYPHFCTSLRAMIGDTMPGEVSLAHKGILYLAEIQKYPKSVLEAARCALQEKSVTISRLREQCHFPSDFQLIAMSRPCPCGQYGNGDRCTCTQEKRTEFLKKSGNTLTEMADCRIWLHRFERTNTPQSESSEAVRTRVEKARRIQRERFSGDSIEFNSQLDWKLIRKYCALSEEDSSFLEKLVARLGLDHGAEKHILRLSRTIADLAGSKDIRREHLIEAAGYNFQTQI